MPIELPPLSRRSALIGLAALPFNARSQAYPYRPVHVIIPYGPGGTTDILGRLISQALATSTGGSFIVENKGGGSTTIAAGQVAKAPPDGYMLLANEMTQTVIPALLPKLAFDPIRDLVPITVFAEAPYVLIVNADVPAKNLRELVALAKAQPGKLNFATGGVGSGPHMAGELLKSLAGIDVKFIAYKASAPGVSDLLNGLVQVTITAAPSAQARLATGRVRALAVAHTRRLTSMPEVPTAAEAGFPEFRIANWFGLAAPKGTPPTVIAYLADEVQKILKNPELREKMIAAGAEPLSMTPAEAARHVEAEAARWGTLVRTAGIKLE
jgi:tripartite-type tricarboxylate transporter receptor subunit TctC